MQSLLGQSAGVSRKCYQSSLRDRRHAGAVGMRSLEAGGFLGLTHDVRVLPGKLPLCLALSSTCCHACASAFSSRLIVLVEVARVEEEGSSEEEDSSACQRPACHSRRSESFPRREVSLSFTEVGRLLTSGGQDLAVKAYSGSCHQGDSGSYHQGSFGFRSQSARPLQEVMVLVCR